MRGSGKHGELSWEEVFQAAENDFEAPVFKAHPVLHKIKRKLLRRGGRDCALLSGSGATVFGMFRDETIARQAEIGFRTEPHLKVYTVSTSSVLRQ